MKTESHTVKKKCITDTIEGNKGKIHSTEKYVWEG